MAASDEQWRGEVSVRLQESAVAHQNTAVILERIKGQLDLHDQRLKALEGAPASLRATTNVIVGVAVLLIGIIACVLGPLITFALSYLSQHLR